MKQLALFFVSVFLTSTLFAQDLFVKAGFGAGTSSSSFNVFSGAINNGHQSILSEHAQMNAGFNHGNWQVETGLEYLVTGVSFLKFQGSGGSGGGGGCVAGPGPNATPAELANTSRYTIKNPHLAVPLMLSYNLNNKQKLSFSPGFGIEALYNFNGQLTTTNNKSETTTPTLDYKYNNCSAAILLKLDIQYRINKQFSVWMSPTYQNMVTSLTTKVQGDYMSRIYDRALLFNVGVKYNFHCPYHCPFPCAASKAVIN